jgi:hypothetical protein
VTGEAKNTAVAAQKALAIMSIRAVPAKNPKKIDHEKRKHPP